MVYHISGLYSLYVCHSWRIGLILLGMIKNNVICETCRIASEHLSGVTYGTMSAHRSTLFLWGSDLRSPLRSKSVPLCSTLCSCSIDYTVSKIHQLWNGIARNYKDRFWWNLTETFTMKCASLRCWYILIQKHSTALCISCVSWYFIFQQTSMKMIYNRAYNQVFRQC